MDERIESYDWDGAYQRSHATPVALAFAVFPGLSEN